jgi:hypothetical protein
VTCHVMAWRDVLGESYMEGWIDGCIVRLQCAGCRLDGAVVCLCISAWDDVVVVLNLSRLVSSDACHAAHPLIAPRRTTPTHCAALRCAASRRRSFAYMPTHQPARDLHGMMLLLIFRHVPSGTWTCTFTLTPRGNSPTQSACDDATLTPPVAFRCPTSSQPQGSSLHRSAQVAGAAAARAGAERHCQIGRAVVGAVRRLTAASLTGTGLGV